MRVAIIGGGISGMSTAYALQEEAKERGTNLDIFVIEEEERLGGKIKTEIVDGWICEDGPLGYIDKKPEVAELVNKLALESELVRANDASSKRYIFVDHKLQKLPMSPPAFIKTDLLTLGSKLGILREPWTRAAETGKDESVWEFGARHLGKEAADKLISAMIVGIYAGDAEKLSLESAFPVMMDLEKEGDGSLIRASIRRQLAKRAKAKAEGKKAHRPKSEELVGFSGKLTTFKQGMQEIVDKLRDSFEGEIKAGNGARGIDAEDGGYTISLEDGFKLGVDIAVMAAPGYSAAKIFTGFDDGLAEAISRIKFVPVNVIVFGYEKAGFEHDLDGFGFVIPKIEKRGILGCLWNTSIFDGQAPDGRVSLRTMIGGAIKPEVTKLDDHETIDLVQRELRTTMKVSSDPEFTHISRHEKAIPQYLIGHGNILDEISARLKAHPGLFLTGNTYRGIGFNDCVVNAKGLSAQIIEYIGETNAAPKAAAKKI